MAPARGFAPAADAVLYARASDLADPVARSSRRQRNPDGDVWSRKPKSKEKLKSSWVVEEESLRLYDGQEKFLVRTALVRASSYKESAAKVVVSSSRDVVKLCAHLASSDQEHLVVLALNTRNAIHAIFEAAIGDADGISIQLQHVLKVPLLTGGVGVILVHNHPGGDSSPSPEDAVFTRKAKEGLACIGGIALLDHIIIARGGAFSFLDAGLLGR